MRGCVSSSTSRAVQARAAHFWHEARWVERESEVEEEEEGKWGSSSPRTAHELEAALLSSSLGPNDDAARAQRSQGAASAVPRLDGILIAEQRCERVSMKMQYTNVRRVYPMSSPSTAREPAQMNWCFSRYSTMILTPVSMSTSAVLMCSSGDSGASYGAETPVNSASEACERQ